MVVRGGNVELPSYLKEVYRELESEEKRAEEVERGDFLEVRKLSSVVKKEEPIVTEVCRTLEAELEECVKPDLPVTEKELKLGLADLQSEVAKALRSVEVMKRKGEARKEARRDVNDVICAILHSRIHGVEALRRLMGAAA
jgi:hypothetical protein